MMPPNIEEPEELKFPKAISVSPWDKWLMEYIEKTSRTPEGEEAAKLFHKILLQQYA